MSTRNQKIRNQKNRKKKIIQFSDLRKLSIKLKKAGKKIVFTTGAFDLLNPDHCRYLAEAKSRGDILVVGVSPDEDDRRLKGNTVYPIIHCEIRMELISHLRTVDYVTETPEDMPHGVLALLQPDVFFTSSGAWEKGFRDQKELTIVKSYGGRIIRRKHHLPYFGIDAVVDHIADIRIMQILERYISQKIRGFKLDPSIHLKPLNFEDQTPKYSNSFNSKRLLVTCDNLEKLGKKYRTKKKSLVFVSVSYDLLHVGHARFIEQAGTNGDILVVGIPSDRAMGELKGIGRPVITETDRAYILGHLDCVDYVVISDDKTILSSLEKLKPNVFFTVQEEWNSGLKASPEYKCVRDYGGKVITSKRKAPFISASAIIDKMALKRVREIFGEFITDERITKISKENSFPEIET